MSLDPSLRIAISRHAALKQRAEGDVLVLPERAIRIGGSGAEILRLCLEPTTAHEAVRAMAERYPDTQGLDQEVHAFLEEMLALGGLVRVRLENDGELGCADPGAGAMR